MKFVTYILDGNAQPRFGFKKDEYIIEDKVHNPRAVNLICDVP